MRLDRQGCGDGDDVNNESMGELVEEIDEQELEEEDDESKKTVSAKTVARRRKDFLVLLPAEFMLQVELLKMLVKDFEVREILIDDCGLKEMKVPGTFMYRYRKSASCFLQDCCYLEYNLNLEDFVIFLAQDLVKKDQYTLSFL